MWYLTVTKDAAEKKTVKKTTKVNDVPKPTDQVTARRRSSAARGSIDLLSEKGIRRRAKTT